MYIHTYTCMHVKEAANVEDDDKAKKDKDKSSERRIRHLVT